MKKYLTSLLLAPCLISLLVTPSWSEERGIVPVVIKDASGKQVGLYKESHALVIGASEYTNGWPRLPGVVDDIREVKTALEAQGFNVVVVQNPNREQLEKSFNDFINKYGGGRDNRLLFYFAGHGHTLKLAYGGEMGYIVPIDAPNASQDEAGFLAKALSMNQMEVYARNIQSKHAVFIFDSCFSGSLFSLTRAIPQVIQEKTTLPVRQFITAGTANQEVPDESLFRRMFIKAIQGDADLNKDGYVTGTELGQYLEDTVTNYSRRSQTPKYGKLRDPILDQGDFVFPLLASVELPDIQKERKQIEAERLMLEEKRKTLEAQIVLSEEKKKLEQEREKLAQERDQVARLENPIPAALSQISDLHEMVKIPGGLFSPDDPSAPKSVVLNDFYMDKYPVIQLDFEKVMKMNPSNIKGNNLPVDRVTLFEADKYCKKIGKRLPTEWEWTKAEKGGIDSSSASIDVGTIGKYVWHEDNSDRKLHPVGENEPNAYGLYDMSGNVWEWTASDYDNSGKFKVLHGETRSISPGDPRPLNRFGPIPGQRYKFNGFRCAR